jgi:fatty acid desaturase
MRPLGYTTRYNDEYTPEEKRKNERDNILIISALISAFFVLLLFFCWLATSFWNWIAEMYSINFTLNVWILYGCMVFTIFLLIAYGLYLVRNDSGNPQVERRAIDGDDIGRDLLSNYDKF